MFSRNPIRPLAVAPLYFALLTVLVTVLAQAGVFPAFSDTTVMRFDAVHYRTIAQEGYAVGSSAFFPLFPWLWRLTGASPIGISIINGALFLAGTSVLVREFTIGTKAVIAFVTLPGIFFLFVPYSEAAFFFGASMLLVALNRGSLPLSLLALGCCTIARPAFTALLPALMIATVLQPGTFTAKATRIGLYGASTALALFVVMWVQRAGTGDPFGFYHAQGDYGNTLRLPKLPLTSWGGGPVVRLDAATFLLGCSSAILLVLLTLRWVRARTTEAGPVELLSLGYVAGISAIALLLRDGEMYSLNRFVLASPFALMLLHAAARRSRPWPGTWASVAMVTMCLFFLLFGSYVHLRTFIWFIAVALYLLAAALFLTDRSETTGMKLLHWTWPVLALAIQLYYFQRYLSDLWVA